MRICIFLIVYTGFLLKCAFAQQDTSSNLVAQQANAPASVSTSAAKTVDSLRQRDMIDILHGIFDKVKNPDERKDPQKINLSFIPTVGYTLSTGFAAGVTRRLF